MSLIPTWPFVVGALVIGLGAGAAADHTIMSGRIDKMKAVQAEIDRQRAVRETRDTATARQTEQEMSLSFNRTLQAKENEKSIIARERDTAVASLRDRPRRQPAGASPTPAATPACKGTTGAGLYAEDSEFLISEAARADTIRAALAACYAQYDDARKLTGARNIP